jgi:RHS repeat-associated protein
MFELFYATGVRRSEMATLTKGGSPVLQTIRTYEAHRDVLASIQNNAGGTTRSAYDYSSVNGGVNNLGQRMGVGTTFNLGGTLAANPGDTSWDYDSLGQLTSADHDNGTTADRAYQYDTIGNRLFSEISNSQISNPPATTTTAYTPDALNQYDAITPYILDGENVIPGTPVVPVFDDDGNMKTGPLPADPAANSTLTWDAENRLVQTQVGTSGPLVLAYYDAQSRRIAETVGTTTTLYLYDGWNCIAEYSITGTAAPVLAKTRTWGLDLSGTPQGAGGVGGLLAEKQGANTFYPTYDGNGNVSEYLGDDGSTAAHFEYDPFGNTVVNTDTGNQFAYRFSTKPLNFSTGLYYYLYRWYDPVTGRWMSRDPIAERGGVNLYGFVGNDAIRRVDLLGLAPPGKGCPKPNKKPRPPKEKGGATAPPKPPGHKGFHHYGNWGGPGWANGGWNYEDGMLPPFDESAPHTDERDLCYKHHDYDIAKCETGEDCPCPEDKKKVSDCIEEADKKLADCLRDAGVKGLEPWAFDTIIPWLVH